MSPFKRMLYNVLYGNSVTMLIRIVLGLVFIAAGLSKIVDPVGFSKTIIAYRVVPDMLAPYGAVIVPSLEIVVGALLACGFKTKSASFVSLLLMALFSLCIILNLYRGRTFNCGCFNFYLCGMHLDATIGPWLLIRNLLMMALLYVLYRAQNHHLSLDAFIDKVNLENI